MEETRHYFVSEIDCVLLLVCSGSVLFEKLLSIARHFDELQFCEQRDESGFS